ncbi:MAG: hypothetical protein ACPGVN_09715, partial [Alphaproteobacteria bacterium]
MPNQTHQNLRVRVAKTLAASDICYSKDFYFERVLDTRITFSGTPVAIEETTLKQLKSFFISYEQQPIDFDDISTHQKARFLDKLRSEAKLTLVLTDRAKSVGDLLQNEG